jgi:hypothetical protein
MAEDWEFEENVEAPKSSAAGRKPVYPWMRMKPGQSIYIDGLKEAKAAVNSMHRFLKSGAAFVRHCQPLSDPITKQQFPDPLPPMQERAPWICGNTEPGHKHTICCEDLNVEWIAVAKKQFVSRKEGNGYRIWRIADRPIRNDERTLSVQLWMQLSKAQSKT